MNRKHTALIVAAVLIVAGVTAYIAVNRNHDWPDFLFYVNDGLISSKNYSVVDADTGTSVSGSIFMYDVGGDIRGVLTACITTAPGSDAGVLIKTSPGILPYEITLDERIPEELFDYSLINKSDPDMTGYGSRTYIDVGNSSEHVSGGGLVMYLAPNQYMDYDRGYTVFRIIAGQHWEDIRVEL